MNHLIGGITPLVAHYGLLIVFFGVIFEGTAMILITGFLCYLGVLPIKEALIVATIGAVIGDQLWYLGGKFYADKLLNKFPKLKEQSKKALNLIAKKADIIAVTARFIYSGGIIFPLMLGASNYPHKKYLILDLIGDTIWASIGITLGYFLGNRIENAFGKIERVEQLIFIVIVIIIIVKFLKNILNKHHTSN